MDYKEEFDKRQDVIKKLVSDGNILCFVPDGTGKYEFCSKNQELQKWCASVKHKKVKRDELKFVVKGAADYLKGKKPLRDTTASITANWKDNPVGTLQNILQAEGMMPEYSEPNEFMGRIVVTLYVPGYDDVVKAAKNQKEARKACAIEFAQKYLGIDVEKEAQKVANVPNPKQAQQTQQPPRSDLEETDKGKLTEKTSAQAGFYLVGKTGTKKTFYAVNDSGEIYQLSPQGKLHPIGKSLWIDEKEVKKGEIFTIYKNNDKIAAFGYKGSRAPLAYASDDLRIASDDKYCYAPFYEDAYGLVSKAEFAKIINKVLGKDKGNFVFANIESFDEMKNPSRYGKRRQATVKEITDTAEAIFDLAKEDIEYYAREDRIERSGTHYREGYDIDAKMHEDEIKEIERRILSDSDLKLFDNARAEQARERLNPVDNSRRTKEINPNNPLAAAMLKALGKEK